jgi:CHAT domain-containing protein
LWKVSDEGTQDLMSAFYKKWLKTGDEYQAFREAQLYIKEKYKYPYYWGAFVLVGK